MRESCKTLFFYKHQTEITIIISMISSQSIIEYIYFTCHKSQYFSESFQIMFNISLVMYFKLNNIFLTLYLFENRLIFFGKYSLCTFLVNINKNSFKE